MGYVRTILSLLKALLLVVVLCTIAFLTVWVVIPSDQRGTLKSKASELIIRYPNLELLFADAPFVSAPGIYVRISPNQSTYLPGNGWLFTVWVKLSRSFAEKANVGLVKAYDRSSQLHQGFGIVSRREGRKITPLVYWQALDKGGWQRFSSFEVDPQQWFMLALSFQNGRDLGLHALVLEGRKIRRKLLGGYRFSPAAVPPFDQVIEIGSSSKGLFRGSIGPVGIFAFSKDEGGLREILKEMSDDPDRLPARISSKHVRLWLPDFTEDRGPMGHDVKFVGEKRAEHRTEKRMLRRDRKRIKKEPAP